MSTKGSTATDRSGIVDVAGANTGADNGVVGAGADAVRWLDCHKRSPAKAAIAKPTTDATTIEVRVVVGMFADRASMCAVGVESGNAADACIATRTAETSFGNTRAVSPPFASNQCEVFRKYWKSAGSGA